MSAALPDAAPALAISRSLPPAPLPEEIPALFWVEHWRAFRRHWPPLMAFAVAGALLGFVAAALQTPLYHAAATLEVQGLTDNLLKSHDGNPNAGVDAELLDMQTQVRIMRSGSLVNRALEICNRNAPASTSAYADAARSLQIVAIGQTRLIEISADSTNPAVASGLVNGLADAFIDQHIESRWQGSERAAAKLKGALAGMRAKLEQSEDALQQYARESGLIVTANPGSVAEDKMRLIQEELARAQAERVTRESRLEALLGAPGTALAAAAVDPATRDARNRLAEIRGELAGLEAIYNPGYSKVERLRAQIAPLETAIAEDAAARVTHARTEYAESLRREQLLEAAYRAQSALVSDEAAKRVHYDVLRRDVDSNRAIFDTMLARVKESAIVSTMRGSNIRVLDPAKPPREPFQPRRGQFVLLGLLAGLFIGGAVVFMLDQTDRTLHLPGDAGQYLGLPEFGAIPSTSRAALSAPGVCASPAFSESFRAVRASLLFAAPGSLPRVLAVTSANPSEGKTTVTSHLAAALAGIGKRVLVIDGDLRRPHLHQVFGGANERGLTAMLAGPGEEPPFRQTAHPGLQILTSGPADANSPDLLYSSRFREILENARKNFDIVLVDTPPMLQIPDARVVGRVADAVLMVVRAGKTTRESALAMRQRLTEDGTAITGCVLNDWNPKKSPGYYGHYATLFSAGVPSTPKNPSA